MTILIICDINNAERRKTIYASLSDYGVARARDAFECDLNDAALKRLDEYLDGLILGEKDAIRLYHVCGACRQKINIRGRGERVLDDSGWIVI